jgi:rubredoxin
MYDDEPLDPRSTWRKRARRVLLMSEREYRCEKCGFKPEGEQSRSNTLDANHKNKIWSDIDLSNLEWLCRTCHWHYDRATAKGVSPIGESYGYGDYFYDEE